MDKINTLTVQKSALSIQSEKLQEVAKGGSITVPQLQQVVKAFNGGAYDMASEYIWRRAMSKLKEIILQLDAKFIANLLQRTDIDPYTPLDSVLSDYTVIMLAEQLGMVRQRAAIKLRQAYELMQYFFSSKALEEGESIKDTEAMSIISDSIEYILRVPDMKVNIEFSGLRERLISEDIRAEDVQITALQKASIFFIRTVCTILSTTIKEEKGTELEHALNNLIMLMPLIWGRLGKEEKWSFGSLYRDVVANGNQKAAEGVKKSLSLVKGFDYVPESLRSNTFKNVARNLLEVHFGFNNYYLEPKAVKELAKLGTSIPDPALAECMRAYILVYIGNAYGFSHEAAPLAYEELHKVPLAKRLEYFDCYLMTDGYVLESLLSALPRNRFIDMLKTLQISDNIDKLSESKALLIALLKNSTNEIKTVLHKLNDGE